ncbi:hypothetical protein [Nostoc sp.]
MDSVRGNGLPAWFFRLLKLAIAIYFNKYSYFEDALKLRLGDRI